MRDGIAAVLFSIAAVLFCWSPASTGGVLLPGFFSDNMVLQRGVELRIFGDGTPDEEVVVEFNGRTRTAWPDSKTGEWMVTLKPLKASAVPKTMTIRSKSGTFTIKNVLVGDVWFCAGEEDGWSSLGRLPSFRSIALKGESAPVRIFEISPEVAGSPQAPMFLSGVWRGMTSKNASKVSAVAYLFGKALHDGMKIPIGVINARFAGSSIQSWIGVRTYKRERQGKTLLGKWNKKEFSYLSNLAKWKTATEEWERKKSDAESKHREFRRKRPRKPSGDPGSPLKPAGLHNSAIAPFRNFRIRGFVWSQGPADAGSANLFSYSKALSLFVKSARSFWNDQELPILMTLPAPAGRLQKRAVEPRQSLERLRSKQISLAEAVAGVHLVSKQDLGWANKLPRFDLARRLAMTAVAAVGGKGGGVSPVADEIVPTDEGLRIIFAGAEAGLIGREKLRFKGDFSSLVGKTIKIKRKGKRKRPAPVVSKSGTRKVVKAEVDLRDGKGKLIKRLKTVWDKSYVDPVADFKKAETALTKEEKALRAKRTAELAEKRRREAEAGKKREELRREKMRENGEAPPPGKPKTPPPALPPAPKKAAPTVPKGRVETTLYILNSKRLSGFAVSGERTGMSWVKAEIDGDAVVLKRKGDDPATRVRYGCADNPRASLWSGNGLPALPFDKRVKSGK